MRGLIPADIWSHEIGLLAFLPRRRSRSVMYSFRGEIKERLFTALVRQSEMDEFPAALKKLLLEVFDFS